VTRAVVFAYSEVGVRCVRELLAQGVEIPLLFTHADDPAESQWFGSVQQLASAHQLRVETPDNPNTPQWIGAGSAARADFLFSFYYRYMLDKAWLTVAARGALNMHGSLLPRYRGRAPVNWAILRGERETGATLHYMVSRADAGDIVDSQAVPILIDDDAREVFAKVTVAAEMIMARSLPALLTGNAVRRPQAILPGEYFGRRRPEDGRIDWSLPARDIHNLVRAVAPPFPGAFAQVNGERWEIQRTRLSALGALSAKPHVFSAAGVCYLACGDGEVLRLLAAASPRGPVDLTQLAAEVAKQPLPLA